MLTSSDLTRMRAAQQAHMPDTAIVQTQATAADAIGELIESFTDGRPVACGLDMRPGSERHQSNMTLTEYDATARLPMGTAITTKDRLKVTHRFGEALATALVFSVVGPVQQGPSGVRVRLAKVDV